MEESDLHDIIKESILAEGTIHRSRKFAGSLKSIRQNVLRLEPLSQDGHICAAIEIQRTWRGYRSRCKLFQALHPNVSDLAVYGGSKHYMARQEDFISPCEPKTKGREKLEEYYDSYLRKVRRKGGNSPAGFRDFCANYIQNWWGRIRRKRYQTERQGDVHTVTRPGLLHALQKRKPPPTKEEACVIIQRTWRRHIDVQVYRYYRDLINFKTRGDPRLMLRCINPNEAKLLDAGLGVHVRFRLAGAKFPPNIYYKIFTHRPIVDMCANSPKDYTRAGAKKVNMRDKHNKGELSPGVDKEGWYERIENNGWRLVSDRLIQHVMNDPLTWETSRRKVQFNHCKLQRRQDIEKKKKKKKIEWMKKMYKDGLLKAKSNDKETIRLIEGAAAGMVATVERDGSEALEEWEVDELLDWTTSLNFEEYMTSWKEIATSANSEKPVEDRLKVTADNPDPYELTFSVEPSARFSRQQSAHENTPVSSMGHIAQHA